MKHSIEIGKEFPINIQKQPGIVFEAHGEGLGLLVIDENVDDLAVSEFRSKKIQFGLLSYRDVLFILARCGSLHGDAPFSWHLTTEKDRGAQAPMSTPHSRMFFRAYLIDAKTGILKAIRDVALSPKFSREMLATLDAQSERPWIGDEAFKAQIASTSHHWPTHNKMMAACTCRCVGE